MRSLLFLFLFFLISTKAYSVNKEEYPRQSFGQKQTFPQNPSGRLTLGVRSTLSVFSEDGAGIGTGGQFRVRLSPRVNTNWFADYISINQIGVARSDYAHIGWSVMYYVLPPKEYPAQQLQPFVLAGHCFDYNKKTLIEQRDNTINSRDRWGSAVQAGIGTHIHLSPRFEITFKTQYMLHLTSELGVEYNSQTRRYFISDHYHSALEGHLLTTFSLNYSILHLWQK